MADDADNSMIIALADEYIVDVTLFRGVTISNEETTEVKDVKKVKEVKANSWYTLDGRRLQDKPAAKGILVGCNKDEMNTFSAALGADYWNMWAADRLEKRAKLILQEGL